MERAAGSRGRWDRETKQLRRVPTSGARACLSGSGAAAGTHSARGPLAAEQRADPASGVKGELSAEAVARASIVDDATVGLADCVPVIPGIDMAQGVTGSEGAIVAYTPHYTFGREGVHELYWLVVSRC